MASVENNNAAYVDYFTWKNIESSRRTQRRDEFRGKYLKKSRHNDTIPFSKKRYRRYDLHTS